MRSVQDAARALLDDWTQRKGEELSPDLQEFIEGNSIGQQVQDATMLPPITP